MFIIFWEIQIVKIILRFFLGSSEGPEVRVKNETAQLHKSVPHVVKTALQQ